MSTLMDRSSDNNNNNNNNNNNSHLIINLKETELRLGLPGSESPERKAGVWDNNNNNNKGSGFCVSPLKNFVSGAKRGFCDTIDGKWGLCVDAAGSQPDFCKPFSPGCGNGGLEKNISHKSSCLLPALVKEGNIIMASSSSPRPVEEKMTNETLTAPPASKAQVVGWPPIRSFRKNTLATNLSKNPDVAKENSCTECLYVKVSMDGAPYLRKVDLKTYSNYAGLSSALEKMFSCFTIVQCTSDGLPEQDGLSASHLMDLVHGSEYVLTYEDKDGDWMLVGDVPWDMFTDSCKRLRIMKGSEAIGLAPRVMEKCRNRQ